MNKRVCLCCGKGIEEGLWHEKCIKRFFGTTELPDLKLDTEELEQVALAQLGERKTVAGVQEKLSLHLDLSQKGRPRLTIVGFPSGYILKPQSSTYKRLPEFEHTAMLLAESCGLSVVKHGLVEINDDELAYITKRIDRNAAEKVHMEDFCQASGILTADKYRSSYEECAELIRRHSKNAFFDTIRFFECLYFCFVIGNSDAHLKNFSFIMDSQGEWSLAPFYDLLPTKVILTSDHEDLGMLFNGKKHNLHKRDFDQFAEGIGINAFTQAKIMKKIDDAQDRMFEIINDSFLDQNSKSAWKRMIQRNSKRAKLP